jgi:hypothetical protein
LIGQHHRDCHESELEGAEQIAPQIETMRVRILALFEAHGPMTDEELLDRYNALHDRIAINSLVPRRYELVRDGKLENSGERRKGRSGVKRIVWRVPSGPPIQLSLIA